MDAAEPPRIVFESTATCADARHAEAELTEALSRSRAPAPAWQVTMRVRRTASSAVQADGDIVDDQGTAVGHREFSGKPSDCAGLARAVGVWASLVLDAEIRRPRPAQTAGEQPSDNAGGRDKSDTGDGSSRPEPKGSAPLPDPVGQSGEASSRRDEPVTSELGVGGFVMSGIGGGSALFGTTPFFDIVVGKTMLLRPAFAFGASLPGAGPQTYWGSMRLDGCLRVVGQYTSRKGIQMDMCGGVDFGALDVKMPVERTALYLAPGPSADMRGELGGDLAVILRGVAGVNVVNQLADTPIFSGRGELGLSWRLQ